MEKLANVGISDCYVRVVEHALLHAPLRHLCSGVDSDEVPPRALSAGAQEIPAITGYTEWLIAELGISIGWDWRVSPSGDLALVHQSVRTNLMLIDAQGTDLGHVSSREAAVDCINLRPWQKAVLNALNGSGVPTPHQVES